MQKITACVFSVFVLLACSQTGTGNSSATNQDNGQSSEPMVKISTEYGDMVVKLYNETPAHRDNFLKLAEEGYYDGTLFHRVISQFMIQGGDPNSKEAVEGQPLGSGGPGYTLPAEIMPGLIHKKGALAAARTGDQVNPERRSSGSQFYIVQGRVFNAQDFEMVEQRMGISLTEQQKQVYSTLGGVPHLDNAYTVFGEVVSGLDVIDKIAAVQTAPGDRPVKDVPMTVTLIK